MSTEWKTIRIDGTNHDRLGITKGEGGRATKLKKILDLYFKERGGLEEIKYLDKRIKKYKSLI